MNNYFSLLAPEILLVVGALLTLLAGLARSPNVRSATPWIGVLATAGALMVCWAAGVPAGGPTPGLPGIAVGTLSFYVRLVAPAVGLLVLLLNVHLPEYGEQGEHLGMVLFALAGVMLTAAADDFLTLFLALELASVPTYALVAAGSSDIRAQEAGLKYFFLGAMAAAVLAYGLSFLYGACGTMRLSASTGSLGVENPYAMVGLILALGGLAYKIAAVPLHVYAPDVYQGAAPPVTGLLGFFPKLAGFVAIIRLLGLLTPVPPDTAGDVSWSCPNAVFWVLWGLAAATMTVGNCVALVQTNVKRILACSSIAHSGYMLIGILVGPVLGDTPMRDGWSAVLFYVVAYGLANLGAFAVLAYLRVESRPVEELDDLSGLARAQPGAALALAICLFSLMGMPPTVGFFAKLYVIIGALSLAPGDPHRSAMIVLAVVGVLNSAVAAAYYLRIIGTCYLRSPRETTAVLPYRTLAFVVAMCATSSVALGLWPRDLFWLAGHATSDVRRTLPVQPPPDSAPAAPPNAGRAES